MDCLGQQQPKEKQPGPEQAGVSVGLRRELSWAEACMAAGGKRGDGGWQPGR